MADHISERVLQKKYENRGLVLPAGVSDISRGGTIGYPPPQQDFKNIFDISIELRGMHYPI